MTIDISGQRFGALVANEFLGRWNKHSWWSLTCDCGETHKATQNKLRRGEVRSCGCLRGAHISQAITTHGHSKTPTWVSWITMRRRCTQPSDKLYKYYGARGITVCERWANSFENFLSDMGERRHGLTLDRIDNSLGYFPENCHWANPTQQSRNRRSNVWVEFSGKRMLLIEACEKAGVPPGVVSVRRQRGWPEDRWFLPKLTARTRINAKGAGK